MFILMSLNYDLVLFYCQLMLLNDGLLLLIYGNLLFVLIKALFENKFDV